MFFPRGLARSRFAIAQCRLLILEKSVLVGIKMKYNWWAMSDYTDNYINDVFKRKYISPTQEKKIINAIIRKKSKAAHKKLAENYMWLAFQIAKKHRHIKFDTETWLWEAVIGLFKAVHQVNEKPKMMTFEDFVTSYIEKALKMAIEDLRTYINIPVEEVEKLNKITRKMKKTHSQEEIRKFQNKELGKLERIHNKGK